jgi:hypothetical protein
MEIPLVALPTNDAERKALPLWTFFMEYFPDVFLAVANVSIAGNKQHNPGEPLHWAREKSTDQMNTAFRHMFDYGRGVIRDTDGQYHLAKAIWRLSAELQLLIEKEQHDGVDTRRESEGHGKDVPSTGQSVLAHAGTERHGLAEPGLPRLHAYPDHARYGGESGGVVRGDRDEGPRQDHDPSPNRHD